MGLHVGTVIDDIWSEFPAPRDRASRNWTRDQYQNDRRQQTTLFISELVWPSICGNAMACGQVSQCTGSLQLHILRLGFVQDVGVGVFRGEQDFGRYLAELSPHRTSPWYRYSHSRISVIIRLFGGMCPASNTT